MPTSASHGRACLDHTGKYLFCASSYDSCLRVYDTHSDSLVAVYPQLPFPPLSIAPNPEQGCIYIGCPDAILAYPDAPPGVEERQPQASSCKPQVSIVRGVLLLSSLLDPNCSLPSVDGRKVMDLRPGANDVRALAPGVYFVRGPKTEDGRPDAAVRKVVITR